MTLSLMYALLILDANVYLTSIRKFRVKTRLQAMLVNAIFILPPLRRLRTSLELV